MTSDICPYPSYKASGLPWLGGVPDHWEVRRAKFFYREVDERSTTGVEELMSVSHITGVTPRKNNVTMFLADSNVGYKLCRPGDIVINTMWAYMAALGVARQEGLVSPSYGVYRPISRKTMNPDYIDPMLRTAAYQTEYFARSRGITSSRLRLYPESFLDIPLFCPPPLEQAAIVRYLDYVDRRIRRYVTAKRKLITLLEEEKQAVVNRAVTRGLDPNARLKPSGVEWLGDVPEHWKILQIGRVIDLVTGYPFKSEGFSFDADDIRLLRGTNVSLGVLRWRDVVRWPRTDGNAFDDYRMEIGDIVLGMDRPIIEGGVRVASVSENDVPALLLQRVARIRPRQELSSTFTLLLLTGKSFADYLEPLFTGISVPHVSPEQIKSYRIALPNTREQTEIVDHFMTVSRSIQLETDQARRQLELIKEYRTRLIADVVTGKLDVREAAAHLPDEADDQDPIEESGPLADGLDEVLYDIDESVEELAIESEVTA